MKCRFEQVIKDNETRYSFPAVLGARSSARRPPRCSRRHHRLSRGEDGLAGQDRSLVWHRAFAGLRSHGPLGVEFLDGHQALPERRRILFAAPGLEARGGSSRTGRRPDPDGDVLVVPALQLHRRSEADPEHAIHGRLLARARHVEADRSLGQSALSRTTPISTPAFTMAICAPARTTSSPTRRGVSARNW